MAKKALALPLARRSNSTRCRRRRWPGTCPARSCGGASRQAGDREFEQGITWACEPQRLFSSPRFLRAIFPTDPHPAAVRSKVATLLEGPHPSNLHHYWDVECLERLGTDPRQVAAILIGRISEPQRQEWSSGTPADWAMEGFELSRRDAYGLLPPPGSQGTYSLPPEYTEQAERDVELQLSRAGVRLGFVLNRAFTAAP
jgi:hypothetical protein